MIQEVTSAAPSKPTVPGRYGFRERRSLPQGATGFSAYDDDGDRYDLGERKSKKNRRKKKNLQRKPKARKVFPEDEWEPDVDYNPAPGEHYYDQIILSKLPKSLKKLEVFRAELDQKLASLKKRYLGEIEHNKVSDSLVPSLSIPVNADVVKFRFDRLIESLVGFYL